MESGSDKTEAATPKRRSEARKKGQVAKSPDLSSTFVLLGLLFALHGFGPATGRAIREYMTATFSHLDEAHLSNALVMQQGGQVLLTLFRAVGPLLLTGMLLGLLVNIAQTGPMWATEALKPDLNRLNPLNGAKRFVSPRALVDLFKSCYKIGLVGYIAFFTARSNYPRLVMMSHMDVAQAVGLVGEVLYSMALRVVTTMLVLAALDYAWQRYQFEKSIRMTKQEVKEEHKQSEGDPQMKSRIRARQRAIARKRMMAEVPTADVVVTNPTHFAVALKYEAGKASAPIVVAKGQDLIALKIRQLAQENDVPIVENPPLARALYKQADLGREIPTDLYEAVAEVLAFVYQINQKRRDRMGMSVNRI